METGKEKLTRGQKTAFNRYKRIFYSSKFLEEIVKLRKEYGIPENGKRDKKAVMYRLSSSSTFSYSEGPSSLQKKLLTLLKKFYLGNFELRPAWGLLFYGNDYLDKFFKLSFHTEFEDQVDLINFPELEKLSKNDPLFKDILEKAKKNHPIGILISPYASQRMVFDFVKENWELIKEFQESNRQAGKKFKQERVHPSFERNRKIEVALKKGSTYRELAMNKLKIKGVIEGTPEWKHKLELEEGSLRSAMSKYRKARKEM